ncbi:MAG: hypothetical protein MRERC_1c227 [Mycoplasmataceae bacterium RC_NB112A]|nr:MAG: hypothetical protein MRERC_1c227 [Mycoplasmataceae bacterium RC_NB112A]
MPKKKLIFTIQTSTPFSTGEPDKVQALKIKFTSKADITLSASGQPDTEKTWKIKELDFLVEKGWGGETQYDLLKNGTGQTFELELEREQIWEHWRNGETDNRQTSMDIWKGDNDDITEATAHLYHYERKNSNKWKSGEITLKKVSSGPEIPGDKDAQIVALKAKIYELEEKLLRKPDSDTSEKYKKEIQLLKEEINKLKKNKPKDQFEKPNSEKFPWLLVIGGGLIIIVLLIVIAILVSRLRSSSNSSSKITI